MVLPQSGCPLWGSWVDPREAPRFCSQEGMFWQLFRTLADYIHVDREIWWRAKKDIWTRYGWSQGAWHAREYVLNEYWQIFVGDRPVSRDAINSHAHVQSKAVFSYAMTVMDKIGGWREEQKWVGSLFAACLWICTEAVLCDELDSTQEYLRRRMLSIMESVNWVCDEALEEHEWVSPLTISLKEEEVLAELDYEIDLLCVVQWGFLWFTAPQDQI